MPDIPIGTAVTLFAVAFGAWAWVVMWGVTVIRREVDGLKTQVSAMASQAHQQMLEVEHRLTVVESDIQRCAMFARPQ
jgi:hypothetical protein